MATRTALLASLLAALHAGAAAQAQLLHIATENSPPTSMLDNGRVVGIATDKVREAMQRAAIDYTLEVLPWKRAYSIALTRANGCVYSTTRTPEREHLFKWAGPTDEGDWVLMGRADRSYQLRTLEDARKLRIGTYGGDARDSFLRSRGFLVDPAPNDLSNPQKLLLGRIDLWAVGLRRDSPALGNSGWAGRIVPVFTFNRVKLYLACNRAVPDTTIARLNAAFEAMQRDGTARRLDRKYDDWMAPKP
ncbi:ABC transporter substrate-binding protein [Massilia sp. PAMC28688]|uniref:substrate-binding periplasmic protein n=1 Tax=Massilia sp. PAMC28688 TaxID=2861283 RepID=UPI001C630F15|nr:ABC transporter substrate-binding protein [Massilia sp. PAMC28688]QYF95714.1 ABC transporter substrate-binding protein [Massilia sp. PAMC28688]